MLGRSGVVGGWLFAQRTGAPFYGILFSHAFFLWDSFGLDLDRVYRHELLVKARVVERRPRERVAERGRVRDSAFPALATNW